MFDHMYMCTLTFGDSHAMVDNSKFRSSGVNIKLTVWCFISIQKEASKCCSVFLFGHVLKQISRSAAAVRLEASCILRFKTISVLEGNDLYCFYGTKWLSFDVERKRLVTKIPWNKRPNKEDKRVCSASIVAWIFCLKRFLYSVSLLLHSTLYYFPADIAF